MKTSASHRRESPPSTSPRFDTASARRSLLHDIDLSRPPFSDSLFTHEILSRGKRLVEKGRVRIVTANVQGRFAGCFGQVDLGRDTRAEVSIVLQRTPHGEWQLDGRSDQSENANNEHVAALLMAVMAEKGACDDTYGLAPSCSRLFLTAADVRAGILYWDDSDARALLERMPLARLEGVDPEVEARLRDMGLKQIVELYPSDEIIPEFREHFGHCSKRRPLHELFWADFLSNRKAELAELGCEIVVADDFGLQVIDSAEFYGEIAESEDSVDWFSFECGIRVGRDRLNLLPCLIRYLESMPPGFSLSALENLPKGRKVPVQAGEEGKYVAIPAKKLQVILSILSELFDRDPIDRSGKLQLHRVRAAQLTSMEGDDALVDAAPERLRLQAEELERLKPRVPAEAPEEFLATLRSYQQDGFEWLQFLREQGLGGVLADDMGLGKTIQTLCHLHTEKVSGRADLPSLILAPKSVVPGWVKEAAKFAPSLRVLALQGSDRKKYYPVLRHCDLVVTSYPVLLRDAEELLDQRFHFVVLDEAHTIKNTASQVTKVAYRLDARHRLCLSGTPIENNLGELWSLFHFLMPGFLGGEESFNRCFRAPIEKDRDEGIRKRLSERVAPLMLRRTKHLVATDLPPKTEMVRSIQLYPKQVEIYEAVRAAVSKEIHEEISRLGVEKSRMLVLEALLKLRQVCNHPQLLSLPSAQKSRKSAKLDWLTEFLPPMVENGHRILIFSQFTGMLSLIEEALNKLSIRYQTLTGQSKDRGKLTDDFQTGKIPVFLISLRAGGTGITLTAADTVIHFDPWWNPALEAQATDRAYRIGQKKPVFVYKLITEGTIEEKILLLQQKKRALFDGILEGTPQKLAFSEEELDDLLSPLKT
ncbi:MAG: DEAD/DEAH box helicase [Verrucomicrobiota bacterium]